MKPKHLQVRIEQCLALAKLSNCSRRKFGAMLIDPTRNVVLMDGYNGGPRGGGHLCGGDRCLRDGLRPEEVLTNTDGGDDDRYVMVKGEHVCHPDGRPLYWDFEAVQLRQQILDDNPPIASGTRMEIGCHHAEMNVICNAAANGVKTAGAWLIVTGEPCLMCAKLLHHAGVTRVYVVEGGYAGVNGLDYLQQHKVEVLRIPGPQDPRLTADLSSDPPG